MDAGLVTSMSGAMAQSKRIDVIANNLANTETPAYKADDLAFEESLMAAHQPETRTDIPEQPYKESELFSRSGEERRPVLYGAEYTDMRAGGFRQTNNSLDLAIEGNGFLEVLTPNGVRLTRAGNLALDAQGRLVTHDGFLILGQGGKAGAATAPGAANGQEQAVRAITAGTAKVVIDQEGNVHDVNNAIVGKLSIVQIANPSALKKEAGNMYEAPPEAYAQPSGARTPASTTTATTGTAATAGGANPPAPTPPPTVAQAKPNPLGSTLRPARIHQGMLEASNVNPILEMTKMIEAHRLFDQNSKLMQVHGDALGRLSEIGKF
ncbi:MAG: flagellar hook basal-body protein [Bdellovibrionales bacterium]|nr:flagellar hook basal-body protein [Bdellovibrionales bacterium]